VAPVLHIEPIEPNARGAGVQPLVELAIIWGAVYLSYMAAERTRLTPLLFQLAIGAILVNTGIIPVKSNEFIRIFAELGIIVIMFALGLEERTDHFIDGMRKSWAIALFGAIGPFIAAYAVARWFFGDENTALMCGLAMTATAVSLTMVSLRSEGLQRSRGATLIMTSALLDDIGSLALVAVLVPIATGEAAPNLWSLAEIAGKATIFFLIVSMVATWLMPPHLSGWFSKVPIIGRHGIRDILTFADGQHAVLAVLCLAVATGLVAHAFGFHPAVGAYMAGLILKEEYFFLKGRERFYEETRAVVDIAANSVIGPVFFVHLGTKIVFDWPVMVSVLPETFAMIVAVAVTQIATAGLAARYTAGSSWPESLLIGFGMLGRAELAFVVMDIAYVENAIISKEVFYMLMFTCFWLNNSVPVSIALIKRRFDEVLDGAPPPRVTASS